MTHKTGSAKVIAALEKIQGRNKKGLLLPAEVVAAASKPDHPLHSRFEWEDTEAAHKWRLHQARNLINIYVTVLGPDTEPVARWISIRSERNDGGGYQSMQIALQQPATRAMILKEALEDMQSFAAKYRHLKELAAVMAAIDTTAGKLKK